MKWFASLVKEAEYTEAVKGVLPSNTNQCYCSNLMHEIGVPEKIVSEMLGH